MRLTCPFCSQPQDVVDDHPLRNLTCVHCGRAFDLISGDTQDPGLVVDAEASPGTTLRYFGDYELLEQVGRGGMGVVFRARQVSLNRIVAVKMILADKLAGDTAVQRFHQEAQAAARLAHAGIVRVHEVGQHAGQHYFSMDYVEGQSLAKRLAEGGPLAPHQAAETIRTVAEAVQYAHQQNVVHRDLKPHNILLDCDGHPVVTDFGLAKQLDSDEALTGSGEVMGTASYMPPEQATGKRCDCWPLADVYSLGAVLYHMLTGRPPFQAATIAETLRQVVDEEPVSPRLLNPDVHRDLAAICAKCLEKRPDRRYESAQELAADVERYLRGQPTKARPASPLGKAIRWCRRRPAVAGLGAMVVLLSLLAVSLTGVVAVASVRVRAMYENQVQLTNDKQRLATEKEREAERALALEKTARQQLDELRQKSVEHAFQQAENASQRGDWRTVLKHLGRARELGGGETPKELLFRVQSHQALNQRAEAREILDALQARDDLTRGEMAQVKLLLGDLTLAESSNPDAAIVLIRQASELGLPPAQSEYAEGLLCESALDAWQHFEKATALEPFYESAHAALLMLSVFLGREAEMDRRAGFMELVFPDDPTPHIGRGMSRLFQGDRAAAEEHLQKAYPALDENMVTTLKAVVDLVDGGVQMLKRQLAGGGIDWKALLPWMSRAFTAYVGKQKAVGFPNLPLLDTGWGRLPAVAMYLYTFQRRSAVKELEGVVERYPVGLMYYFLATLKVIDVTEGAVDHAAISALYPLFRKAADADSPFTFHRRSAELGAILCSAPQATPGTDGFDSQVRERTATAIFEFLQYDALTVQEFTHLAQVSYRTGLWDLWGRVCDRWMRDHPADSEAMRWSVKLALKDPNDARLLQLFKLALKDRNYARVLQLYDSIPPDSPQRQELRPVVDEAHESLRKLVTQFPADSPPSPRGEPKEGRPPGTAP